MRGLGLVSFSSPVRKAGHPSDRQFHSNSSHAAVSLLDERSLVAMAEAEPYFINDAIGKKLPLSAFSPLRVIG